MSLFQSSIASADSFAWRSHGREHVFTYGATCEVFSQKSWFSSQNQDYLLPLC